MAKAAHGWTLRAPAGKRTTYSVRFSHGGRQIERSTGQSTRGRAARAAARIYAATVQAEPKPARRRRRAGPHSLAEVIGRWLAELPHAETTRDCYKVYGRRFVEWFERPENLTTELCAEYVSQRLQQVQAQTVGKEATALRSLIEWAHQRGHIGWAAAVPKPPKRALGNAQHASTKRVAAVELSPAEVEAIIEQLPEWSQARDEPRYPVRARFIVAYETGLRPSTLDRLSVPEHYTRGGKELRLTAATDKVRWGRTVPLSERAQAALKVICPKAGPVFGKHDYRKPVAQAAREVLDARRAKAFTGCHLRSARATHLCERSQNLPGIQYLLGHKQVSTTARYVKASKRAAESVLDE